jgi:hypothetical protein
MLRQDHQQVSHMGEDFDTGCFGLSPTTFRFLFLIRLKEVSWNLLRVFCKNERPFHQGSSGWHFPNGIFNPFRIDSLIFGIDSK